MIQKNIIESISLYSNALMVLTSVHHIYGAIIYDTPWRVHVLMISIPLLVVTVILGRILRTNKTKILFWFFWLIVFILSFALIGMFEGVYNHLLKDVLFFSGLDNESMLSLFPPPKYVMPNDFFFEFTGVLQGVLAIFLGISLFRAPKLLSSFQTSSD